MASSAERSARRARRAAGRRRVGRRAGPRSRRARGRPLAGRGSSTSRAAAPTRWPSRSSRWASDHDPVARRAGRSVSPPGRPCGPPRPSRASRSERRQRVGRARPTTPSRPAGRSTTDQRVAVSRPAAPASAAVELGEPAAQVRQAGQPGQRVLAGELVQVAQGGVAPGRPRARRRRRTSGRRRAPAGRWSRSPSRPRPGRHRRGPGRGPTTAHALAGVTIPRQEPPRPPRSAPAAPAARSGRPRARRDLAACRAAISARSIVAKIPTCCSPSVVLGRRPPASRRTGPAGA